MNQKPWLWRKKSMEKTIFAMDKAVSPSRIIEEEVHKLPKDKETGSERSSKSLNEKLATVLLDSHAEHDPLAKHAQMSQQEIREVESAETVTPTYATLQEPLQPPPSCAQEEQEQRLCGTIPKISKEHEKIQKELEEKLRETSKRIEYLTAENTHLTNALLAKEKSIGDLFRCKQEADAEFSTLMARLDSTEKENAFLRYEFHMLEKELEIRKEEMEYSRQYADVSHKQYLESSQKASKLEAECQKLRLLLQKKSPGPAGLGNMKNEVGMMRRETDMRRRKSNPARDLICKTNDIGNSTEVSQKSISLMIKRLQDLDEENKALKRILTKKNSELDSSRFMYAETVSRLSQAEILLRKLSENQKSMELARCCPTSNDLPLIPNFDISSDDEAISSGSWANALISELEHLRTAEAKNHRNSKAIEVPDMSFMDDFVEMEKRAIVSVDKPKRGYGSDISGRELVPVEQDLGLSERKQEIQFKHTTTEKSFDWLQIVLNAILEEKCISKRSLDELFDDIKIALGCINHPTACKSDTIQKSRHLGESDSFYVNSFSGFAEAKSNQPSLRKSVHRIVKLIEGIAPKSFICNNCPDCLEENQHSDVSQSPVSKEYFVHVFQWKVSDLNPLLHQLVHTCKDLLTGRADFENFIEEVAFALDWSINNCATSTNASIARDKIKKHFSCHLSQNGNENQIDIDDKQSFHTPSVADPDDQGVFFDTKNNQYDLLEENRKLKDDLKNTESAKKDLEAKLLSVTDESQNLTKQCQEAQNSIKGLESEVETLKESKEIIEDQIEKQKLISEDLDTQLTIAQAKLNNIFQKFSSLEVELEDKKNSCEELEATCLELQLQLESIAKKESPTYGRYEVEKIYQTGWEITTASSKLAECQETILNLGKQLKALASSSEAAIFDNVVSITGTMANPNQKKNLIKRSSLRNQMQAEDGSKIGVHKSIQIEESESSLQTPKIMVNDAPETSLPSEQNDKSNATGSLAIVPSKKQGGFSFLRKLLFRRKKGKNKGTQLLAKA
ncbi:filament-like plant protein 7 [Gastrolobium bilobum]|uniref:filament-like plant protein 7 n=1 Tax=Gastrolobium bilobum TaxID=150636 RepID=UPI002AAF7CEA|nr:filament-like plant protein 7 [Gastrolobium bilobum]